MLRVLCSHPCVRSVFALQCCEIVTQQKPLTLLAFPRCYSFCKTLWLLFSSSNHEKDLEKQHIGLLLFSLSKCFLLILFMFKGLVLSCLSLSFLEHPPNTMLMTRIAHRITKNYFKKNIQKHVVNCSFWNYFLPKK